MIERNGFEFGDVLRETRLLHDEFRRAIAGSDDAKVLALAADLDQIGLSGARDDSPPLRIAFVGQYNAGKSTIMRALTGRADIVIDSDVCTDSVTAYDWNGVQILDTPGIHAGYADHDETTYTAIDRADLLVFVITNELFDATIGRHFRNMAFERRHAPEMLLVVNKMGQDPGTPATKRSDIERVTAPLSAVEFRTVYIDARSWLEAQDATDETDRRDLMEIANLGDLVTGLNRFISEHGFLGRLSTPLFSLRALIEQAGSLLSVDFPEERAALELLHRKRGLLLASRSRLQASISGVVARAVSDIGTAGDEVAESIESGRTEDEVEISNLSGQQRAKARCEALAGEVRGCVEQELADLKRQLDALSDGVLARELREHVDGTAAANGGVLPGDVASPGWAVRSEVGQLSDWPAKATRVGNIAKDIGNWAAKWATGPMADGAAIGTATAARGSQAHQIVYSVGKFFGVKFQPWGAVNVARAIGSAAVVIAAVGGVLAVVAQFMEERQQDEYRLQLRDARDSVRSAYRESAALIESAVMNQFEAFSGEFYGSELAAVDECVKELGGSRSQRNTRAKVFGQLASRAESLIARLHQTISGQTR